jgi:hypothetical protein
MRKIFLFVIILCFNLYPQSELIYFFSIDSAAVSPPADPFNPITDIPDSQVVFADFTNQSSLTVEGNEITAFVDQFGLRNGSSFSTRYPADSSDAAVFDGINDDFTVTTKVMNKFTVAWKGSFSDLSSEPVIGGASGASWLGILDNNTIRCVLSNTTENIDITGIIEANTEYVFVVVRNGTNLVIYIDGEERANVDDITTNAFSFDKIGGHGAGLQAKMTLKKLLVWNNVLTESQIDGLITYLLE